MQRPLAKQIYLAQRNAALTPEEFPPRWKQHARLAASIGDVNDAFIGVAQCSRVLQPTGIAGLDHRYDGVCLLTLTSVEAIERTASNLNTLAVLVPDELKTFSDKVANFSMSATEELLLARHMGGTRGKVCLISFLRRRPGLHRDEFKAQWQRHAALQLKDDTRVLRQAHNHVFGSPSPGFDYDGIGELWFASLADAQAHLTAELTSTLSNNLAGFADPSRSLMLLTQVTHAFETREL